MSAVDGRAAEAEARRWVPFGDLPNQILHPDTAEAMLRLWKERQPAQFGATLAEVLTGTRPGNRRKRDGAGQ